MHKPKKSTYLAKMYLALFILCGSIACNESTDIGSNLINSNDLNNVFQTDTFTIQLSTIESDTIRTAPMIDFDNNLARYYAVGSLNDEVFGQTTASAYLQLRLAGSDISFGAGAILDSIVLTLSYESNPLYGDTASTTSFYVHEMTEDFVADSVYYSDQTFAYNETLLGEKLDFKHKPDDSLTVNYVFLDQEGEDSLATRTVEPHLRMKLNAELGQRLLSQSGGDNFADDEAFTNFFKGLYITADPNSNVMAHFNVLSSLSSLVLYYKNSSSESRAFAFRINSESAAVNNYTHDYGSTIIPDILASPQPNAQELGYLQGMGGLGLKLEMPYADVLQNAAINKAELTFYVLQNTTDIYAAPNEIVMFGQNATTNNQISVQKAFSVSPEDNETLAVYEYNLLINYYMQEKISGSSTFDFEKIFVEPQSLRGSRAIIYGPEHPDYPMKLNLIYTNTTEE
ncbi:MAG: DUF4270 family protein [Chitinophagales bacterium]